MYDMFICLYQGLFKFIGIVIPNENPLNQRNRHIHNSI